MHRFHHFQNIPNRIRFVSCVCGFLWMAAVAVAVLMLTPFLHLGASFHLFEIKTKVSSFRVFFFLLQLTILSIEPDEYFNVSALLCRAFHSREGLDACFYGAELRIKCKWK